MVVRYPQDHQVQLYAVFVTNMLNLPLQDTLDMHKQVQSGNADELTKASCIECSNSMVTTFGHSLLGK